MDILADIAGFIGSALILAAFAYVNVLKRQPDITFNLLNFAGAAALSVSLWFHYNLPSLLLECAWMAIAVYGIISLMRKNAS